MLGLSQIFDTVSKGKEAIQRMRQWSQTSCTPSCWISICVRSSWPECEPEGKTHWPAWTKCRINLDTHMGWIHRDGERPPEPRYRKISSLWVTANNFLSSSDSFLMQTICINIWRIQYVTSRFSTGQSVWEKPAFFDGPYLYLTVRLWAFLFCNESKDDGACKGATYIEPCSFVLI